MSRPGLFDCTVETLLRDFDETLDFGRNFADGNGHGGITVITIVDDAEIKPDNVTLLQQTFRRRNAVDDLIVDGNAQACGKAPIALKGRLGLLFQSQFRDEEFFEPKKILQDEGATIVVASTTARICRGMKGGTAEAAISIADAKADDYAGLVLCGGSSVPEFLWNDKKLQELVTAIAAAGKVVAAICLATVVLAKAKLLASREATVYFLPEAIQELEDAGAKYVKETLLIHNNIILAEGPPDSQRFGQAIRAALAGYTCCIRSCGLLI